MFSVTPDVALAAEIERADEVVTPQKKILARVERSWSDYGFREEIKQIKRTIVSGSFSGFPIQTGSRCHSFASSYVPKTVPAVYRCPSLDSVIGSTRGPEALLHLGSKKK
jgi:hypothetical protein